MMNPESFGGDSSGSTGEGFADTFTQEEFPTDLADGMENDADFIKIREDLITDWKTEHGEDITSAEGQNFLYGDPSVMRRGETPITIEDRARDAFGEQNPERAEQYAVAEKIRVYESPSEDPVVKEVEEWVVKLTNQDPEVAKITREGRGNYADAWQRAYLHAEIRVWNDFIKKYPEKTEGYKDFAPVRERLEGHKRQAAWEQRQNGNLEEQTLESPNEESASESEEAFIPEHIEDGYRRLFEAQERVGKLQKEAEESRQTLEDLQTETGVPAIDTDTASDRLLQQERVRLEEELQAASASEQEFLGLNDEAIGEQNGEPQEVEARIEKSAREMEELAEATEEMLRDEREKFVISYIKEQGAEFLKYFDSSFTGSVNGEQAKKLFYTKWWYTVLYKERAWIETGETEEDFDTWGVSLELRKFEGVDGEKQHITDIKISSSNSGYSSENLDNILGDKTKMEEAVESIRQKDAIEDLVEPNQAADLFEKDKKSEAGKQDGDNNPAQTQTTRST